MEVKELIEMLEDYPEDSKVFVWDGLDDCPTSKVHISKVEDLMSTEDGILIADVMF